MTNYEKQHTALATTTTQISSIEPTVTRTNSGRTRISFEQAKTSDSVFPMQFVIESTTFEIYAFTKDGSPIWYTTPHDQENPRCFCPACLEDPQRTYTSPIHLLVTPKTKNFR